MARFFLIFAAVCVCQVYGRAATPPSTDHLKEIGTEAQKFMETLNTEFKKLVKYEEPKEITEIGKTMEKNFNILAAEMKKALATLNTEAKAHSGEAEKAMNTLKTNIEEQVKKIQSEHPTETAKVKEYQKKVEEFYNDVATRTKTAIDAVAKDTSGIQEETAKQLKNFSETVKSGIEHMGKDLKKIIDDHQKTH